jgi:hypothetical protein
LVGTWVSTDCEQPPDFWIEDLPLDEFNQRMFEANRDLPLEQVLQDSQEVWSEILAEVRLRSETYLFTEQSLPGVSYKFRLCVILKSESYGHYLDHVPSLLAWIEALNSLR